MKAMKTRTIRGLAGGLVAGTMLIGLPVLADDRGDSRRGYSDRDSVRIVVNERYDNRYDSRRNSRYSRSNRYNDDYRYSNRRSEGHSYRHQGPVTVRLSYDANGDGRIRLKRMLRDQHGIDANDWRIRAVNIRNKSRYEACADLSVGGRSTGPVFLRRGLTTIDAPRGRSDGRWVLGFENAKVRDVAVILEPRRESRNTRSNSRSHKRDDGYAWNGPRGRVSGRY